MFPRFPRLSGRDRPSLSLTTPAPTAPAPAAPQSSPRPPAEATPRGAWLNTLCSAPARTCAHHQVGGEGGGGWCSQLRMRP